jgi:hypothetical protein
MFFSKWFRKSVMLPYQTQMDLSRPRRKTPSAKELPVCFPSHYGRKNPDIKLRRIVDTWTQMNLSCTRRNPSRRHVMKFAIEWRKYGFRRLRGKVDSVVTRKDSSHLEKVCDSGGCELARTNYDSEKGSSRKLYEMKSVKLWNTSKGIRRRT